MSTTREVVAIILNEMTRGGLSGVGPTNKKSDCMSSDDNGSTQMTDRKHTYSHILNKITTFFILILFLFRVHIVDISSIDEQHITTKEEDDDEKESGPALYISPLCNWMFAIYTIPRLSPHSSKQRGKKRAHFIHKRKGFRYNMIIAYLIDS